jgi:ABC-type ATPase involved in cell division
MNETHPLLHVHVWHERKAAAVISVSKRQVVRVVVRRVPFVRRVTGLQFSQDSG